MPLKVKIDKDNISYIIFRLDMDSGPHCQLDERSRQRIIAGTSKSSRKIAGTLTTSYKLLKAISPKHL